MLIDGGRHSEVLLKPLHKGSNRLPYVLLIILLPITLVSVYYSTFLGAVIPIFGCQEEAFGGIASPEMDMDTNIITMFLTLLPRP